MRGNYYAPNMAATLFHTRSSIYFFLAFYLLVHSPFDLSHHDTAFHQPRTVLSLSARGSQHVARQSLSCHHSTRGRNMDISVTPYQITRILQCIWMLNLTLVRIPQLNITSGVLIEEEEVEERPKRAKR